METQKSNWYNKRCEARLLPDGMKLHKSVFGNPTHFKMASNKNLTKNVVL